MRRISVRKTTRRLRLEQLERREVLSVTFVDSGQVLPDTYIPEPVDLDGDGDLDLVLGEWSAEIGRHFQVWFNDGDGVFRDSGQRNTSAREGWFGRRFFFGDLDMDGDVDVIHDLVRWLNDGSGTFEKDLRAFTARVAMALGDVDGDRDLDAFQILGHCFGDEDQPMGLWMNDGLGNFQESTQQFPCRDTHDIALDDLDGDGDLDAFVVNAMGSAIGAWQPDEVWLNEGDGNFLDSGQRLGSSFGNEVTLADLNVDGYLDAIVSIDADWGPGGIELWFNDGTGRFEFGEWLSRSFVSIGDVDLDGDLDVFRYESTADSHLWLNDGSGAFVDTGQSLGAIPVALADIDGDGDLDAFVRSEGDQRVWMNQTNHPFAAGDSNLDGQFTQLDIVLVLQTAKYNTGEPATWSEGDWNGDGLFNQLDIVAAQQTGNYLQGPDDALMAKSEADRAAVNEFLAHGAME